MLAVADPEVAARLRSERNQGRAPDMGWVDHDRLGFNYRLTDLQAALGIAQLERARRAARRRARVAALYGERLRALDCGAPAGEGDPDGLVLPVRRPRRRAAQLVRLRGAPPGGSRPRRGRRRPRPARGRGQGVHALHPPAGALPRALRLSRRASSRSPRTPRRACWRCRSSRRSTEGQIERVCEALERGAARRLDLRRLDPRPIARRMARFDGHPTRCSRGSTPRSASTGGCGRRTSPARGRTSRRSTGAGVLERRRARRAARAGSTRSPPSSSAGEFEFADDDEDIHMAVERRLTEIVGAGRRQAPHRPLAQRPGRDRPGAVRARARRSGPSS